MSVEGIINVGPSNINQAFGNFTWNSPSQAINFSFGGGLTTVNGDMTVASTGTGSIILKSSGGTTTTTVVGDYIQTGGRLSLIGASDNHNLNIRGDFSMSGGTLTRAGTGTANVMFAGTTEQAVYQDRRHYYKCDQFFD